MAGILNAQEVAALLRGGGNREQRDAHKQARTITPWNIREAGQLPSEQASILSALHDGFARNLSITLGAYLRVPFEVRLTSVEQLIYDEFLAQLPENPYVMSYHLHPNDAVGAMQIDHALVFPAVDLLLGGTGRGQPPERGISDIEEQIAASVARVLCKELQSAWQPLGLDLQMGERQNQAQLERMLPSTDKALALCFEVQVVEVTGTLRIMFPAALCNTLLRQVSRDWAYRRPRSHADSGQRLRQRLLNCKFDTDLGLAGVQVPLKDILELEKGSVLKLPIPAKHPAALNIEKRSVFDAYPVRVGGNRAAHLAEPIQVKEKPRNKQ